MERFRSRRLAGIAWLLAVAAWLLPAAMPATMAAPSWNLDGVFAAAGHLPGCDACDAQAPTDDGSCPHACASAPALIPPAWSASLASQPAEWSPAGRTLTGRTLAPDTAPPRA